MTQTADFEEARQQAAAFIGIDRAKSSGRVRRSLLQKGIAPAIADQVVRYFIEIDYINDERAAARIASRYQGGKLRSRRALASVLVRNGVEPTVAARFVLELETDLRTAAALCRHHFPGTGTELEMMKLLNRRGYAPDLARRVIREHLNLAGEAD